jgi:hypothetical protein
VGVIFWHGRPWASVAAPVTHSSYLSTLARRSRIFPSIETFQTFVEPVSVVDFIAADYGMDQPGDANLCTDRRSTTRQLQVMKSAAGNARTILAMDSQTKGKRS